MQPEPTPLNEGFILGNRWAVEAMLGRGGFGITYAATDTTTGRHAAIKELAPHGVRRAADGRLDWTAQGPASAHRMRHQFLQEGRLMQRLAGEGVPQVWAVFSENDTAYLVMELVPNARTLSQIIEEDGPWSWEQVEELVLQVLASLSAMHERGILHLDLKPSNILMTPTRALLIDFGSARQWHSDLTRTHTAQFTPGYAAPEQFSDRMRRTPSTDLYGLAATAWHLVQGTAPPGSPERAAGAEMAPMTTLLPSEGMRLATALDRALVLPVEARPSSAVEMRDLILPLEEEDAAPGGVQELDDLRYRLRKFRVHPKGCPSCGEVLEQPKPLRKKSCPVCREGRIELRKLPPFTCPGCRTGILRKVDAEPPAIWCPKCRVKQVELVRSPKLMGRWDRVECECGWSAPADKTGIGEGTPKTPWVDAAQLAERPEIVYSCDVCSLQFDVEPDGRWRRRGDGMMSGTWQVLHPEEWARVAGGLEPDSGNAACSHCGADYFLEGDKLTLLAHSTDPYHFGEDHLGRLLSLESARWLAVGKESGEPGYVCRACGTELDEAENGLVLARTMHPVLRTSVGEKHPMADWQRMAQNLPQQGTEEDLNEALLEALAEEFVSGKIPFDAREPQLMWRGEGLMSGKKIKLSAKGNQLTLGGLIKKEIYEGRDIDRISVEQDEMTLDFAQGARIVINIIPVHLAFKLKSGSETLDLDAVDLARRLSTAWPWIQLRIVDRPVPQGD